MTTALPAVRVGCRVHQQIRTVRSAVPRDCSAIAHTWPTTPPNHAHQGTKTPDKRGPQLYTTYRLSVNLPDTDKRRRISENPTSHCPLLPPVGFLSTKHAGGSQHTMGCCKAGASPSACVLLPTQLQLPRSFQAATASLYLHVSFAQAASLSCVTCACGTQLAHRT